jgi:hypothetical protein
MQCAGWTHLVVVLPPALELVAHVGEREEDLDVQAFIAQPSVKRLDVAYAVATRKKMIKGASIADDHPSNKMLATTRTAIVRSLDCRMLEKAIL